MSDGPPRVSDTRHIRRHASRIAEVVPAAPTAAVPGCPGWDVSDLAVHLGGVHRWVIEVLAAGEAVTRADPAPDAPSGDPEELAAWLDDGAARLVEALNSREPSAPTWTPFRIDHPTVATWIRRQTHETAVHRLDAEDALAASGAPAPDLSGGFIDAAVAADGVDENLEIVLPRLLRRADPATLSDSVHLHCTDTAGEWTVSLDDDGDYVLDRSHRKGDAAVRGSAENLLRFVWGRPVPDGAVDVLGDVAAASAWFGSGGF